MKGKLCRVCLLLMALLMATQLAQAEELDLSARGVITLEMQDGDKAVSGGVFWLYRVGDPVIRENNLQFELTEAFRESAVSLEDLRLSGVAEALFHYTENHPDLEKQVQTADAQGKAQFQDVECGLYLVVQKPIEPNYAYERMSAFIVSMPMTNSDGTGWEYSVTASPKLVDRPLPTPTPTPKPDTPSEKLPQTGMLMWPIPVLGAAGIALFALGWILCFSGKKHE